MMIRLFITEYRMLGNAASPANIALASRVPVAATTLGKVGMGVGSGALFGGLTPVGEGNFADEKLKQMGAGAVTGGVIPLIGAGIGRAISPNASRNPQLQLLKNEDVEPTIGQTLGGVANRIEEKLQSVPLLGDAIAAARGRTSEQFQQAAYNRALSKIGDKLPSGVAGRDALQYTENALSNRYDDVLNSIGAIQRDGQFQTKLQSLEGMVKSSMLPKAEKDKFFYALNEVKGSFDQNGVITSEGFKKLESSLGKKATKIFGEPGAYSDDIGSAVKQLQAELRDMLKRNAGASADDLAASNAGWANFKRAQNAAGRVGAESGEFTPAQFLSAVRQLDKSKDKAAFARGSALGQDLGDAGKAILTNKVPDSGTATRLLMGGGALGSGLINPAIPASLIGGAAMYTPQMQSLLRGLVSSRPGFAKPVADALQQTSPFLLPAAGQVGFGLLNQ